jgi:hypothetical protein
MGKVMANTRKILSVQVRPVPKECRMLVVTVSGKSSNPLGDFVTGIGFGIAYGAGNSWKWYVNAYETREIAETVSQRAQWSAHKDRIGVNLSYPNPNGYISAQEFEKFEAIRAERLAARARE